MATVFSGERLLSVDHISDSGNSTYYTAPSGRWAKITLHKVSFTGSASGVNMIVGDWNMDATTYNGTPTFGQQSEFNSSGFVVDSASTTTSIASGGGIEILITAGQTVRGSSADVSCVFTVQEYANP